MNQHEFDEAVVQARVIVLDDYISTGETIEIALYPVLNHAKDVHEKMLARQAEIQLVVAPQGMDELCGVKLKSVFRADQINQTARDFIKSVPDAPNGEVNTIVTGLHSSVDFGLTNPLHFLLSEYNAVHDEKIAAPGLVFVRPMYREGRYVTPLTDQLR